mmetsp:Transcript_121368/g.223418  ORF Transcript_121368/g.223418 Transcript_121368/m.223418 type:complete len:357 (+) Transcript_121368:45-1115(+)
MRRAMTFSLLFAGAFVRAEHPIAWRDMLLQEARLRTLGWYADESLLDMPQEREGVTVRMLKEDQICAGQHVPVVFSEFTLPSVRPVDVFNALATDPSPEGKRSPCGNAITESAGQFPEGAIRAWSTEADAPVLGGLTFVQWEVVDANFANDTFWLVTSTLHNDKLLEQHPVPPGDIDGDVCLISYYVTRTPEGGARVVGTRHVNFHFLSFIPFHWVYNYFPQAWEMTIICKDVLSKSAQVQRARNWSKDQTVLPDWMLGSDIHGNAFYPPGMNPWETVFAEHARRLPRHSSGSSGPPVNVIVLTFALCCCLAICSRSGFKRARRHGACEPLSETFASISLKEEASSSSEEELMAAA